MKGLFRTSASMILAALFIISLLAGCGGGGGGGGISGGGGGGGYDPGTNPDVPTSSSGTLTVSTSVPAGTDGSVNGTLPGFTVEYLAPAGSTSSVTTDSNGNATFGTVSAGNYLATVYNPTYPSTVVMGLVQVTPSRGVEPKELMAITTRTTTAALVALRYTQADSGRVAGMEISVLLRIALGGSNAKFEAVRTRLEQYLASRTRFFDIATRTITDQALLADVDAARNSITMIVDTNPYMYETNVATSLTLYAKFNHDLDNVPPQNTSYTVTHRSTSNPDVTYTINASNYQAYGNWSYGDRSVKFTLSAGMAGGARQSYDWAYGTLPTPRDGTPLETDTAGKTNTQVFWTR